MSTSPLLVGISHGPDAGCGRVSDARLLDLQARVFVEQS